MILEYDTKNPRDSKMCPFNQQRKLSHPDFAGNRFQGKCAPYASYYTCLGPVCMAFEVIDEEKKIGKCGRIK